MCFFYDTSKEFSAVFIMNTNVSRITLPNDDHIVN